MPEACVCRRQAGRLVVGIVHAIHTDDVERRLQRAEAVGRHAVRAAPELQQGTALGLVKALHSLPEPNDGVLLPGVAILVPGTIGGGAEEGAAE